MKFNKIFFFILFFSLILNVYSENLEIYVPETSNIDLSSINLLDRLKESATEKSNNLVFSAEFEIIERNGTENSTYQQSLDAMQASTALTTVFVEIMGTEITELTDNPKEIQSYLNYIKKIGMKRTNLPQVNMISTLDQTANASLTRSLFWFLPGTAIEKGWQGLSATGEGISSLWEKTKLIPVTPTQIKTWKLLESIYATPNSGDAKVLNLILNEIKKNGISNVTRIDGAKVFLEKYGLRASEEGLIYNTGKKFLKKSIEGNALNRLMQTIQVSNANYLKQAEKISTQAIKEFAQISTKKTQFDVFKSTELFTKFSAEAEAGNPFIQVQKAASKNTGQQFKLINFLDDSRNVIYSAEFAVDGEKYFLRNADDIYRFLKSLQPLEKTFFKRIGGWIKFIVWNIPKKGLSYGWEVTTWSADKVRRVLSLKDIKAAQRLKTAWRASSLPKTAGIVIGIPKAIADYGIYRELKESDSLLPLPPSIYFKEGTEQTVPIYVTDSEGNIINKEKGKEKEISYGLYLNLGSSLERMNAIRNQSQIQYKEVLNDYNAPINIGGTIIFEAADFFDPSEIYWLAIDLKELFDEKKELVKGCKVYIASSNQAVEINTFQKMFTCNYDSWVTYYPQGKIVYANEVGFPDGEYLLQVNLLVDETLIDSFVFNSSTHIPNLEPEALLLLKGRKARPGQLEITSDRVKVSDYLLEKGIPSQRFYFKVGKEIPYDTSEVVNPLADKWFKIPLTAFFEKSDESKLFLNSVCSSEEERNNLLKKITFYTDKSFVREKTSSKMLLPCGDSFCIYLKPLDFGLAKINSEAEICFKANLTDLEKAKQLYPNSVEIILSKCLKGKLTENILVDELPSETEEEKCIILG
ncbi:MAG: hypothetical protein JW703_04965 [Candidatus Diapherotrites archaeon]|nr:hypothetical protein [Candidatus Diapherotrites archaeon]